MKGPRCRQLPLWLGALLLCGCVAQQADLVNVEKGLNAKIAKLDKQERELHQSIKDFEKMVRENRAQLNQDIVVLRDADLPSMHGEIEKGAHQLSTLRSRVDDLEHQSGGRLEAVTKRLALVEKTQSDQAAARDRAQDELAKITTRLEAMSGTMAAMAKTMGGRIEEHDKVLTRGDHAEKLTQQLSEQMTQYGKALAEFKKALTGVGDRLAQDEQRFSRMENDSKATAAHLNEVNKSVATVAKALETVGGQIVSRIEEQERRLQSLDAQVSTLSQTVGQLQGTRESSKGAAATPEPSQPLARQPAEPTAGSPEAAHAAEPPVPREALIREGHAKDAYDRYLSKFKHGDLEGAMRGFSEFLTYYPSSDLAPNAQYWLGECFYSKREFERAIEAFDRVKLTYPSSEKVPAALLKKGFAYLAMKDPHRASSVWRQVVDGYPKSPEAGKAQEKLAQLKSMR